jgi:hypothetical protein
MFFFFRMIVPHGTISGIRRKAKFTAEDIATDILKSDRLL